MNLSRLACVRFSSSLQTLRNVDAQSQWLFAPRWRTDPAPSLLAQYNSHSPTTAAEGEGDSGRRSVCVVQGASRGLGLEFTRQLLQHEYDSYVVATCRNPGGAVQLTELASSSGGRLEILPVDITEEATIAAAAKEIARKYGRVDLLINASGVLHIANDVSPETSLRKIDPKAMAKVFAINSIGPALMMKHFEVLLRAGRGRGRISSSKGVVVVASVSARVGSIGDNHLGGWYSYRASKSALNQLMKTAAAEFARKRSEADIVCVALHPGTVDTDLSKPFQRNVPERKLFTPSYSVGSMLNIINSLQKNDNGKFFAWDGQEIPW